MKINYNTRPSSFLLPLRAVIRKNQHKLQTGGPVSVNLPAKGFEGDLYITIDPQNPACFVTNWTNTDPTWFPARIKAAATALRDSGYSGRFKITHDGGLLTMRQV
jgi:hypothetical protein